MDPLHATFQLWSDLHLEMSEFQVPAPYVAMAPILFLTGDIGVPGSYLYTDLLRRVAPAHEFVFCILGNHECYGNSLRGAELAMEAMCCSVGPNVIFLNNSSFDLPNHVAHRIVGSTLWSDVEDDQRSDIGCFIADYRRIEGWTIGHNNARHVAALAYLRGEMARARADKVTLTVLTHHAPLTSGTSNPMFAGSAVSSAFQTDLSHMMGHPIRSWCFGHTHHCSSQTVNQTHVLSNQKGYVGEDTDFSPARVWQL